MKDSIVTQEKMEELIEQFLEDKDVREAIVQKIEREHVDILQSLTVGKRDEFMALAMRVHHRTILLEMAQAL